MNRWTARLLTVILLFALLLPLSPADFARADGFPIRQGARGEDVAHLKEQMYELGYFQTTKFSPIYNDTTAERVRLLQKQNGLPETGEVDEDLWALIFSEDCISANEPAKKAENDDASEIPVAVREDPEAPYEVPGAPERDERGFLTGGEEFTTADPEAGFWAYLSGTLQVVIHRYEDTAQKIVWFETDVRTAGKERMRPLLTGGSWQQPRKIARANQAVLAFSDDFYSYRKYNKYTVGIEIRDEKIISDKTKRPTSSGFPKLENLAYFPDGSMKCYDAQAHTAQEYLDMGATDVLAFGPILVTDGQLGEHMRPTQEEAKQYGYYHYREPRCALGMVSPGHYIVLTVNGRQNQSKGVYLDWLAWKMLELGAQEALNLDGGGTVALIFMGESINVKATTSRNTSHLMSFGTSELVPSK